LCGTDAWPLAMDQCKLSHVVSVTSEIWDRNPNRHFQSGRSRALRRTLAALALLALTFYFGGLSAGGLNIRPISKRIFRLY